MEHLCARFMLHMCLRPDATTAVRTAVAVTISLQQPVPLIAAMVYLVQLQSSSLCFIGQAGRQQAILHQHIYHIFVHGGEWPHRRARITAAATAAAVIGGL